MNNKVLVVSFIGFILGLIILDTVFSHNYQLLKRQNKTVGVSEKVNDLKNNDKNGHNIKSNDDAAEDYFVSNNGYQDKIENIKYSMLDDKKNNDFNVDFANSIFINQTEPIKIGWRTLININYELKFSKALDFEVYAPVFNETVKSLNEREVIIKGYVIPLFENEEPLALSANPYASCFFCGQASPASVMSMYMKNKGKVYKTDDFKTFKGTLYLNYDDPNEFYYVLKDVVEVN